MVKEYSVDLTRYEILPEVLEDIKNQGIDGYGGKIALSKGCYKNPPMSAKVILRYKNCTFEGKISSVFTYDFRYEITVLYNKFTEEVNKSFIPEMIPTGVVLS